MSHEITILVQLPPCLMPQEGHPGDRELRHAISAVDDGSGEDAATEVGDVLDVHFALVPMGRVNGDRGGYGVRFIPPPPQKKKNKNLGVERS